MLAYALAVLLGWLVAPLVLPPAPLPLTRPLSAALLAALAAVALRDHGAATRRGSQVTALAVVAVAVASAITDIVGVSTLVVSYGNPWQPYLGDSRLWASIWSAIPLALAGGSLLGGTSTDFNVMTRREQWSAEVSIHDAAVQPGRGAAGLCLVLQGGFAQGQTVLQAGQGLWWDAAEDAEPLLPGDAHSRLVLVSLEQATQAP